jgi:hypothetical protein
MNNNYNRKKQQAAKRSLSNDSVTSQIDISALDDPECYIFEEKFLPYDFTKPEKDAKQKKRVK